MTLARTARDGSPWNVRPLAVRAGLALGDMVRVRSKDGGIQDLLGVAPVAMQQGRYAAKLVRARLAGSPIGPFRYLDRGNLATIGRARAVVDLHAIRLSGFLAWAASRWCTSSIRRLSRTG